MTSPAERPARTDRTPTSNPVLRRAVRYELLLTAAIAVVGAIVGGLFAGWVGITSALIGTGMAGVFLAITAISIIVANRFSGSDLFVGAFFGIVLGGWLVKFVLFLVLVFALKDQPWVDNIVLFFSIVAGVVGSLVVDVFVVAKARLPYASDARLPGESSAGRPGGGQSPSGD